MAGLANSSDYLCDAMERFCTRHSIPPEFAGATLIALSGSLPEIFISAISTIQTVIDDSADKMEDGLPVKEPQVDLGVGAIVGSGIIAMVLIPAICALTSVGGKLNVRSVYLVRDSVFYLVALLIALWALVKGISVFKSLLLISVYLGYIFLIRRTKRVVVWTRRSMSHCSLCQGTESQLCLNSVLDPKTVQELNTPLLGAAEYPNSSPNRRRALKGTTGWVSQSLVEVGRFLYKACRVSIMVFDWPIKLVCGPKHEEESDEEIPEEEVVTGELENPKEPDSESKSDPRSDFELARPVFGSMICIGLLSMLVTSLSNVVATQVFDKSGLTLIGLIVVSLGAEIPDIINATTIIRRNGSGSMVTAACIGAQIMNLSIGLGLPWLLCSLFLDASKIVAVGLDEGLLMASLILLTDVVLVIGYALLCSSRDSAGRLVSIDRFGAASLIAWYVGSLTVITYRSSAEWD